MQSEQRTPDWYAARKGKITGSNVGAILGFDPNRNADDVMRAMVRDHFGVPAEFTGNIATAWGEANEAGAITDYVMETERLVRKVGFIIHENGWLGASPDGMVGNDGLIEVKCPFKFRDTPEPVPFVPVDQQKHYHAQMQVQMFVTGANWCDFWQWAPNGHKLERVERDDVFLEWALPELYAFYQHFLKEVETPERHLEPKLPEVDTPRAHKLLAEYRDLQEAKDRAEERAKEVLAEIVASAGGVPCVFAGAKLSHVQKAGSVKYAEVVKKHLPNLNLDPYRGKPSSYWMLK